jgi:hypothetical protein
LSEQISFVIGQTGPNIIDSISESFYLFPSDGYFFDDGMLKLIFLVGYKLMEMIDF